MAKQSYTPGELGVVGLEMVAQGVTINAISRLFPVTGLTFNTDKYIKVEFARNTDLTAILNDLNNDPAIEYAQLNHVFRINYFPDDSAFSKQWALHRLEAPAGWDLTMGAVDIIVGIIDTGVDYLHEDLRANIWINAGEDLNQNGVVDSSDFNGIDDDDNGFIDDLRGWDFTDAPGFPDGGDYRDRDNEPMDEHPGSHGTRVAGIIGAVADNRIGIAGVAPHCRIMPLRAGTSQGLLEEEDVACAILYAIANGARVLNMSFGDTQVSQLFTDIIQYAYENNCIMVTSAGNSGSDEIHFPSGYDETISVGATDSTDYLAGFSNYGSTIDVCAPGVAVLSTERNNGYSRWSGTSASAPYVTGLVALLLSQNSSLDIENVRGILTASADDLGLSGWDRFYGAGRININRALKWNDYSLTRIYVPATNAGFASGPITIRGTAFSPSLQCYSLQYGIGTSPVDWFEICRCPGRRVIDGVLGTWDIENIPDSSYTLRLLIENQDNSRSEDKVIITIDRTPPIISNILIDSMWDADLPAVLVQFNTDDLCVAWLELKIAGTEFELQQIPLNYQAKEHRILLTQQVANELLDFKIQVRNSAGLTGYCDNDNRFFRIDLTGQRLESSGFVQVPFSLPAGYLLNKTSDFDNDGAKEVIINEYRQGSLDKLKIYEFNDKQFNHIFTSHGIAIPRDIGDGDSDDKLELLIGAGRLSYILESARPGQIPAQVIWADTNDFWASRYADLDGDNRMEIIGRGGNVFTIWENSGDNQFTLLDSLVNFTSGDNLTGVPHSEVADFDGDGWREILLGDYDGDIYLYEANANDSFVPTWQDSLPLMDSIDFLTSGDYDGDGIAEFAAGCHSDPGLNAEHEYDARHWLYRIYDREADNSYRVVFETRFFGFESPKDFDAGVSSGDVDNDGRDELLINVFPDFYLIDYTNFLEYKVAWHYSPNRSNAALVADLDGNGLNEMYFNDGDQIIGFEALHSESNVAIPTAVTAIPLDQNRVKLTWKPVSEASDYRVYRGLDRINLQPVKIVKTSFFIDDSVITDTEYWYGVTALVTVNTTVVESQLSRITRARPGLQPRLVGARAESGRTVRLSYSEPMGPGVLDQNAYVINEGSAKASSVIIDKSGREVVVTLPELLEPGRQNTICVYHVNDLDHTPIDSVHNCASFRYETTPAPPYLVEGKYISNYELYLVFSESMDPYSCANPDNYTIQPDIIVDTAELIDGQGSTVSLKFKSDAPVGALGRNYTIQVSGLSSAAGQKIRPGRGDRLTILFSRQHLADVFTYPNPFRPGLGKDTITFANLTPKATIKIMTLHGQVIRTLEESDGNGGIDWDLKDEKGDELASGIYLYYVEGNGDKKVGKFAILR